MKHGVGAFCQSPSTDCKVLLVFFIMKPPTIPSMLGAMAMLGQNVYIKREVDTLLTTTTQTCDIRTLSTSSASSSLMVRLPKFREIEANTDIQESKQNYALLKDA
jgi:hypothetical protein